MNVSWILLLLHLKWRYTLNEHIPEREKNIVNTIKNLLMSLFSLDSSLHFADIFGVY